MHHKVGKTAHGTEHKNVIVLAMRMEVYQTCNYMLEEILLGTLELEADSLVLFEDGGPIPYDVKWAENKASLLDTVKILCDKSLKPTQYERSFEPGYTVRNRGGRFYKYKKFDYSSRYNRGGYLFAPSETSDGDLVGKAGIKSKQQILAVYLQLNHGDKHQLLLRYPAEPRKEEWIYQQHEFQLWLKLIIGQISWEIEGPKIVHPDYEFPTDKDYTGRDLNKALAIEYGNPKAVCPLNTRGGFFLRYLDPAMSIGNTLRSYIAPAAQFINDKVSAVADPSFTVTPVEIANTMLCEGGIMVIKKAIDTDQQNPDTLKFGGYEDIGVDQYGTRWKKDQGHLHAFTKDILETYLTDPKERNLDEKPDERGTHWKTFKALNMEEAVYAVAGLYAFFKEQFALLVADKSKMGFWATECSDLPLHVQHYWVTMFFNTSSTGDNTTPRVLNNSIEHHDVPWSLDDKPNYYQGKGEYNAAWRTATFRYLAAQSGL